MNFTEIVDEVVRITARPDKRIDAGRAVNKAINFFCIEGNFQRDFDELLLPTNSTDYAFSISLADLPRFRKIHYISPVNSRCMLTRADPARIFSKGEKEQDVFYVAGEEIKVSVCHPTTHLKIGYYKFPPILSGVQTFWLSDISPFMIIDWAASDVFNNIGNPTEARKHETNAAMAFTSAQRDYKYGSNYG
jgi:hypothetical protein